MKRTRHRWTASDDSMLRDEYGRTPTRDIARQIGVSENATSQRAHKLGLRLMLRLLSAGILDNRHEPD